MEGHKALLTKLKKIEIISSIFSDHKGLKLKDWKQIFQANGQEKKAGVAILISDKIDIQRRAIRQTQKVTS